MGGNVLTDPLRRLEKWYLARCDGDWEHSHGVRISTLDNPGWQLAIDLGETPLANKTFKSVESEVDGNNWFHCRVRNSTFEGAGGPFNLTDLIETFLEWARQP